MTKLNIMSDLHLDIKGNEFDQPKNEADIIILPGDIHKKTLGIEWAKEFDKPVIYVAGNHEFYDGQIQSLKEKLKIAAEGSNVHVLDDDEVIINGIRFLGGTLWTDFNLHGTGKSVFAKLDAAAEIKDYKFIKYGARYRKLRPEDTEAMNYKTLSFLKSKLMEPFEGRTIVVTHHAPSIKSISPQYETNPYCMSNDVLNPAYASNFDYLMGEGLDYWFHGHIHTTCNYNIEGTNVICNPRGYQSYVPNSMFDPNFIVEV